MNGTAPHSVVDYLPYILGGLWYTIGLSVAGIAAALLIGVLVGLLRTSRANTYRWAATMFIEFFRGTSEVVQFYWVFFALPVLLSVRISPIAAAVIVIGITQGAYVAEVVRGSIQAVPRTQVEAAVALNMRRATVMRRVVFPQAWATMLPTLANISIDVVKNTSIVSLVTVADITFRTQQIRGIIGHSFELYGLLLIVYLAIAIVLTFVFRWLERRLPHGLAVRQRWS